MSIFEDVLMTKFLKLVLYVYKELEILETI